MLIIIARLLRLGGWYCRLTRRHFHAYSTPLCVGFRRDHCFCGASRLAEDSGTMTAPHGPWVW